MKVVSPDGMPKDNRTELKWLIVAWSSLALSQVIRFSWLVAHHQYSRLGPSIDGLLLGLFCTGVYIWRLRSTTRFLEQIRAHQATIAEIEGPSWHGPPVR